MMYHPEGTVSHLLTLCSPADCEVSRLNGFMYMNVCVITCVFCRIQALSRVFEAVTLTGGSVIDMSSLLVPLSPPANLQACTQVQAEGVFTGSALLCMHDTVCVKKSSHTVETI